MSDSQFEIGKRNLNVDNHWEVLSQYKIEKPVIICLGGNGTISRKDANSFCKIAEGLIGIKKQYNNEDATYSSVDVIGVVYNVEENELYKKYNLSSFRAGKLSDEECNKMVDELFLPLCFDEAGNKLSGDDVCSKFSLITFFTYCYGASALFQIFYVLNNKLLSLGYSKEEVYRIFSCCPQITFAPFTMNIITPTIEIVSRQDCDIGDYYNDKRKFKDGVDILYQDKDNHLGKETVFRCFESLGIYSSRLLNESDELFDEHGIKIVSRDNKWRALFSDKNNDIVSQMIGYSLARFVSNSIAIFKNREIPRVSLKEIEYELNDVKLTYSGEELKVRK